jgi:FtsP/CotA-like multicopper oxidase with cupredoxin domain
MRDHRFLVVVALMLAFAMPVSAKNITEERPTVKPPTVRTKEVRGSTKAHPGPMTSFERRAAAERAAAARLRQEQIRTGGKPTPLRARPPVIARALTPGATPDYFGTTPNWALSPLPVNLAATPLNAIITTAGTGAGATATANVANGVVTDFTVTAGGSGYTVAPTIAITGGAGTGATAAAIVDPTYGVILAVTVLTPGSGYTSPSVAISGTGAGATATAVADPSTGAISAVMITNGGSGYGGPVITVNPGTSGGAGATGTATVDPVTGAITDISVTNPGYGYFLQRNANGTLTGAIRKFVDRLPGLGSLNANNLGQYIPVAIPDVNRYPNCDYYEIGLTEYTQQMHSDLLPTKLRGYYQKNTTDPTVNTPHYLGPVIVARNGRAVRIKFTNELPTGTPGNLFLPVDHTIMGAGEGPLFSNGTSCDPTTQNCASYKENRAVLHLHGGRTPWISDGTPHQWTTPAGENTPYPKGVSVSYVPDMDGGTEPQGTLTFYYTNQQSARLMFYHDHAYGITRLNVYAGEAAGYIVRDATLDDPLSNTSLLSRGIVPADEIPLIIQDKTFLPSATQLAAQDPTWPFTLSSSRSDLWFPHVYMPNQNPADMMGANAMGRWDYGPWFWPPFTNLPNGSVANPLAGTSPEEGPVNPGTGNPSIVPEGFMDTPLVNGTAYPYLNVQPKPYRFRILNACNDRMLNLQLYAAESNNPMWDAGTGALLDPNAGEVNMVPAVPGNWPAGWPTPDGRSGGFPDPKAVGPSFVQIGTEGGILPAPAIIQNRPIGYNYNRRDITVLNVQEKALFLGPAERADVVVDFSQYAGKTLILYQDAPTPVPAFDPRTDYYTGDPDQTSTGGAPPTQPGYGPNTRTIMQIRVAAGSGTPFNLAALQTALPVAYGASQPKPLVPETVYNQAFGTNHADTYPRIQDTSITFTPSGGSSPINMPMQPKCIQELFDDWGRMNATLGVELPFTNMTTQTTIPYKYIDPPTEVMQNSNPAALVGSAGDGTQIWKITHNGVDTHAIHVHMFDLQLLDRIGWDGMVKPPNPNEVGWKETVVMNPLEDVVVAVRPIIPTLPFKLPDNIRPLDVTMPLGATMAFTGVDPNGLPITVQNDNINFGWEYVWHCHLLGHEENDMMRPMCIAVTPDAPTSLAGTQVNSNRAHFTWTNNAGNATGFTLQRASNAGFSSNLVTTPVGLVTSYTDQSYRSTGVPYYYRVFATGGPVGSTQAPFTNITTTSGFSNVIGPPAGVTTLISVTQAAHNTPVVVNWSYAPAGDQSGFTIQRAVNQNFTGGVVTFTAPAGATSYNDNTTVVRLTYYYRVAATDFLGRGAWSTTRSITAR